MSDVRKEIENFAANEKAFAGIISETKAVEAEVKTEPVNTEAPKESEQPLESNTDTGATEQVIENTVDTENNANNNETIALNSYKALQRKLNEKDMTMKQLKQALLKFPNLLKFDEDGNPVGWDESKFQQPEKQNVDNDPEPPKPNADLKFDDPEKWEQMNEARMDWKLRQKEKEIFNKLQAKEQEEIKKFEKYQQDLEYNQKWSESLKEAIKDYPEFGDPKSKLNIRANELRELPKYKHLYNVFNANEIFCKLAAAELGIMPKQTLPQKETKKSDILALGKSNSGQTINTAKKFAFLEDYKNSEKRFLAG